MNASHKRKQPKWIMYCVSKFAILCKLIGSCSISLFLFLVFIASVCRKLWSICLRPGYSRMKQLPHTYIFRTFNRFNESLNFVICYFMLDARICSGAEKRISMHHILLKQNGVVLSAKHHHFHSYRHRYIHVHVYVSTTKIYIILCSPVSLYKSVCMCVYHELYKRTQHRSFVFNIRCFCDHYPMCCFAVFRNVIMNMCVQFIKRITEYILSNFSTCSDWWETNCG